MDEHPIESGIIIREQLGAKIEIAQAEGWEAFRDIRIDALKTNPESFGSSLEKALEKTPEEWRDDLSQQDKFFVVAKVDDSLSGVKSMAGATKSQDGSWNIMAVYTRPDSRGKGAGVRVLREILEEIKTRKGEKVFLAVKYESADAIKLYERLGFKAISKEQQALLVKNQDSLLTEQIMELNLIDQEKLDLSIKLAEPEDWQAHKDLIMEAIESPDARMFGYVPEDPESEQSKQKYRSKTEAEWRKNVSDSPNRFVVMAWNKGKPVGMGVAKIREVRGEKSWYLSFDYVKEENRGQGIQPKIIATRLVEIKRRKGKKVTCIVVIDNDTSLKNVQSFGFKIITKMLMNDIYYYFMELADVNNSSVTQKINEVLNER